MAKYLIQLRNQTNLKKQMKKVILTTAAIALLSAGMMAQSNARAKSIKTSAIPPANITQIGSTTAPAYIGTMYNRCGTQVPTRAWDEWFNQKVEERKQDMANGRTTANTYTIAVIFHVLSYATSGSVAVGTFPNLTQAQINSQIPI